MKTLELTLTKTVYSSVNTLDNLEVGKIYSTSNYKMFKPLLGNRGSKTGYVNKRVNFYKQLIKGNEFLFGVIHVILNMKHLTIDGNNRLQALRELGYPVNFIILNEPKFNEGSISDILNAVSDYNSINSSWFATDSYQSALYCKENCAVAIEKLKFKFENPKSPYRLPETMLTPSRVIALAKQDKHGLSGKSQKRVEYCNDDTANIVKSKEFEREVEFVANVINFVKQQNTSITEWFVIRCIMPEIWSEKLDLDVTFKKMLKRGFKRMDNEKMSGIKTRVNEILATRV